MNNLYDYMQLEDYFDNKVILKRFTTFEDLKNKLNEDLDSYNLKVLDYSWKDNFDNDFQDFELTYCIGTNEEEIYDLTLWYTISRIGERVIVESNFEEVK